MLSPRLQSDLQEDVSLGNVALKNGICWILAGGQKQNRKRIVVLGKFTTYELFEKAFGKTTDHLI